MQTPIFECFMVRRELKNKYQKDMCSKEIGLRTQSIANHSKVDSQHDDHLNEHGVSPLSL